MYKLPSPRKFLYRLAGYFPRPIYPIPTTVQPSKQSDEVVRRVTARAADGSVRLARGQIMYPARIEKLYGSLSHVDF